MRHPSLLFCLLMLSHPIYAQNIRPNPLLEEEQKASGFDSDSTETTNVPEGIYVWKIDPRFGDIHPATYDTIPHRFQNENFTSGPTGRYNYTGNLGAPRISRLFNEQTVNMQYNPFIFKQPYDFFLKGAGDLLYTNTKSPFTNITYHSCGNKTNGEDRIRALFSVNSGKKLGMGFKADYLYGRGYYEGQSTADFDGTLYASYRGDEYQMHTFFQHTYLKTRENGGIENDDYVKRPESFPTKYGTADMPINLARAWNKIGGNQFFLTHRYNLGFHRYRDEKGNILTKEQLKKLTSAPADTTQTNEKVKLQPSNQPRLPRITSKTEENENHAQKDSTKIISEFVPVTSFIHTLRIDDNTRKFIANVANNAEDPGYFADFYLPGDSANDRTHHLSVENTLAFELHEGFNKWMKMGLRLFGKHEFASYDFRLPYAVAINQKTKFKENYITVGGQILKEQGNIFRYNVLGEIRTTGKDWGEFNVEANASLNIPIKKDSLKFLFNGFVRNERPSFYYRKYRGRNAWWDNNDLNKVLRSRISATLNYKQTTLTAHLENVQNHLYFKETLTPYQVSDNAYPSYHHAIKVAQASKNLQLLGITLEQDFRFGILNWENELSYQVSSNKNIMPVPAFTGYTNLYILFRIARVLQTEIGADMTYFTKYYAPTYSPIIGQYAIQDEKYQTKVGNYPIVNVYANFHLKRTRFYIMASHVNYSSGAGDPFLVPHYPLNRMVIRFGISWNFIN